MKSTIPISLIAAMFSVTSGYCENSADYNAKLDVRAFCKHYDALWTERGASAIGPLFMPNAVMTALNGSVIKGSDEIAKTLGELFKPPSVHKCIVDEGHPIGDNGVWTIGVATITGLVSSNVRFSSYMVKKNGELKIQMVGITPIQDTKR